MSRGSEGLAGLEPKRLDGFVLPHRAVVRPVRRQRVVVVDDRQDARAEWNGLTLQALGIARAVPPLVVALDVRRHGVGERHRLEDVGADRGVQPDVVELRGCQPARLGEDVLRHRQLADIVEQGRNLQALHLVARHPGGFAKGGRSSLDASDVVFRRAGFRVDGLVTSIDRARQRLHRRQMQVGDDADVFLMLGDTPEVDAVAVKRQPQQGGGKEHQPHFLRAHGSGGERRCTGRDETRGTGP